MRFKTRSLFILLRNFGVATLYRHRIRTIHRSQAETNRSISKPKQLCFRTPIGTGHIKSWQCTGQFLERWMHSYGRELKESTTLAKKTLTLSKDSGNSNVMELLVMIAWKEKDNTAAFNLLKQVNQYPALAVSDF